MKFRVKEKYIHLMFVLGVLIKAFDGLVEILAGIALLNKGPLAKLAEAGIQKELIQEPHDFIAIHLQHLLPVIVTNSTLFATVYLFFSGGIKILLVIGLLCDKLWVYPTAIWIFTLFIVYQLYRYTFTHSMFLIVLTFINMIVIVLIWHEYQLIKNKKSLKKTRD